MAPAASFEPSIISVWLLPFMISSHITAQAGAGTWPGAQEQTETATFGAPVLQMTMCETSNVLSGSTEIIFVQPLPNKHWAEVFTP